MASFLCLLKPKEENCHLCGCGNKVHVKGGTVWGVLSGEHIMLLAPAHVGW